MIGYLTRKGLEALGVDKDLARGIGIGVALVTFDPASLAIEGSLTVADGVAATLDVTTAHVEAHAAWHS